MNEKIKVLFVTYEYDKNVKGGIARVINGISRGLREKLDLDIIVDQSACFAMAFNLLLVNVNSFIMLKQYHVHKFRYPKRKISFHNQFQRTLINLIQREKYDIVHLFHIGELQETAIRVIREHFPHIKIIYSCHSIARFDMEFRKSLSNQLGYEHYILNNIDHLHLLNRTSLKYLKQSYPQFQRPVSYSIIPNGVDETSFNKKTPGFQRKIQRMLKKDRINVLCMSRWGYGKGLEYLLDAIPEVLKRFDKIQFILAGRKSKSWENDFSGYREILDQKIATIKDYVIVLGWLNDTKRNTVFAEADIWVMPSLLEYFPYSILEPMAAKIPIISARIDSVCEMLTENRECLFYEPRDPGQLAGKIITLANDAGLRNELARNAYEKAMNLYQWGTITKQYFQMYQETLDGAGLPVY